MTSKARIKRKKAIDARKRESIRHAQEKRRFLKEAAKINNYGIELTRRQFDAYCYSRLPMLRYMAEELEWYKLFEGKLLAVIFRDVYDNDYGYSLLGRDLNKLFRCIEISPKFSSSVAGAKKELEIALKEKYSKNVESVYPQQDESMHSLNLFEEKISRDQQHEAFKVLSSEPRYEAARVLITEIANSFETVDAHYEREFQSINFQARLWELYLHVYFHSQGLYSHNEHTSPDFELEFFGEICFVEAVTVNSTASGIRSDPLPPSTHEEALERLNDFMPIKFGSSLYSKLRKRYWDDEHVSGKPLIFAIHDYHHINAMTWSRTALSDYLYGVRAKIVNDTPVIEKIYTHNWEGKSIPSGFFSLPDSENVSAVLFSNQATITKFNRMGKIGGLGSSNVKMIRKGFLYNPDPEALQPIPFVKDLDEADYEEAWAEGLIMFHNPNAKHPVSVDQFSDISHITYSEECGFNGRHQPFDVLGSMTMSIVEKQGESA